MTDAPLNRPLAPGRHARRPLLLALVSGVFPMVIEGMAVALGGARQRPLLGRGALSTTVSHDRPWCACGRTPASPPQTWNLVADARVARRNWSASWSAGGALVERGEILHLNVRRPDGTVLLSLGRLEATRGDVHQVTAVGDLVQ